MIDWLVSIVGLGGAGVIFVGGLVLLAGVIFTWALRADRPRRAETDADQIVGDFPHIQSQARYPDVGSGH